MIKILIVEDEKPISDLLKLSLNGAGYSIKCVYDGFQAANLLENEPSFDLILLDVMLPGIDGFELMEYIRPLGIPVIFITAKNSTNDKVKGLRLGADDYIVKPFEIVEMLARVESVLRRSNKLGYVLTAGDAVIDLHSHTVTLHGEEINLTNKEFDVLVLLAQNAGTLLYRETIYERIWGGEYPDNSRTIDLHVQRVRKKCELQDKIKVVPKVGYRLDK